MQRNRLIVELLDVVHLSSPNFVELNEVETAAKIVSYRLRGKRNPPSYDMAVGEMPKIATGLVRKKDLLAYLDTHKKEDWRRYLKDVGERLFDLFSRDQFTWYPVGRRPIETFSGVWTKPAIRGVRVLTGGDAFPCLINPRASLVFGADALRFLARGIYELHVIDNPRAIGPMIVDLGRDTLSGNRANRIYMPDQLQMMSLEKFEDVLRKFVNAVELAGLVSHPADKHLGIDLFRPRK